MADHYEVLQVHPKATPEIISKAYRTLAARHHPDRQKPEDRPASEDLMKRINEAYAVLSDPQKRSAYDRSLSQADISKQGPRSSPAGAPSPEAPRAGPGVRVADVSRCWSHPERQRVSTCTRCRAGLCADCRVVHNGRGYCAACAADLTSAEPEQASAQAPRPPVSASGQQAVLMGYAAAVAAVIVAAVVPHSSTSVPQALLQALAIGAIMCALTLLLWKEQHDSEDLGTLVTVACRHAREVIPLILLVALVAGAAQVMMPVERARRLADEFRDGKDQPSVPAKATSRSDIYNSYPWTTDDPYRVYKATEFVRLGKQTDRELAADRRTMIHYILRKSLNDAEAKKPVVWRWLNEAQEMRKDADSKSITLSGKQAQSLWRDATEYLARAARTDDERVRYTNEFRKRFPDGGGMDWLTPQEREPAAPNPGVLPAQTTDPFGGPDGR